MRNLLNFLIKYSVFLLFLLLEIISLVLIVNNQDYQKSVFLSSSNSVVSSMYETSNSVFEFFNLRDANQSLSEENTALKNELNILKERYASLNPTSTDSLSFNISPEREYRLIAAKVINSSTNKLQNYITINKGERDGVKIDMGVVNEKGVVGIVKTVSNKFAVVIPVLNKDLKINSKFKRNKYSGSLTWNGEDYRIAKLNDIARHVRFNQGDTLITSGFTDTFPEGIPVGTIEESSIKESDSYYKIDVKLAVNFRTISYVKIIDYLNYEEQQMLEKNAQN